MYIQKVQIQNVRGFRDFEWNLPAEAGWHVIIGDNGSGKSSLLRSIALALAGPNEAAALRQSWEDWITTGSLSGNIRLDLLRESSDIDRFSGKGNVDRRPIVRVGVQFVLPDREDMADSADHQVAERTETPYLSSLISRPVQVKLTEVSTSGNHPERHVWGSSRGWFSVSYGPFRRFTGDPTKDRMFLSNSRLAAHLSLFDENVGLSESLQWLQKMKLKNFENSNGPEARLLTDLIAFVNQDDFLPHGAKLLNITSEGAEFKDGNGSQLLIGNLSDGYRSILSLTFELIRQIAAIYQTNDVFTQSGEQILVDFPGVVMIDEPDAHLHPTWQQRIGFWFLKHFPKMQFIVTTHSPLVCHAAIQGSVWRLPRPGSDDHFCQVDNSTLDRLLYGNILDAYGTQLFGKDVARSRQSREKMQRLAELNHLALQRPLQQKEIQEREALRAMLPTAANSMEDG